MHWQICPGPGIECVPADAFVWVGVEGAPRLWLCTGTGNGVGQGYSWLVLTAWGLEVQDPRTPGLDSGEKAQLRRPLWHSLTVDIWEPRGGAALFTAGAWWWIHVSYGWQAAPCTNLGVVPEVSLEIGVAVFLASFPSIYMMAWALYQNHPGLAVPAAVAGAPLLGEPNLPVAGNPVIYNSPSLATHTPHMFTHTSLTSLLSYSLLSCHSFGHHVSKS